MLPDFPESKEQVLRGISRRVSTLEKELHPVLAQVGRYVQREGKRIDFEQIGYGRKVQEAEEYSVPVQIDFKDVPHLIGAALEEKIRLIADQTGVLKMKSMFRTIDEATEQTGNRLAAQGRQLSASMVLDMIEMTEASFDKSGNSKNSFLLHPDLMPAIKRLNEELENDPELKRRLESINRRKFEEWIDRESRRKLVD